MVRLLLKQLAQDRGARGQEAGGEPAHVGFHLRRPSRLCTEDGVICKTGAEFLQCALFLRREVIVARYSNTTTTSPTTTNNNNNSNDNKASRLAFS